MCRFLLLLVSVALLSLSLMTSPVDAYPLEYCNSICPSFWPLTGRCIDDCTGQITHCHLNCAEVRASDPRTLVLPREEAGPSADWNTSLMSTIHCSGPMGSEEQEAVRMLER